MRRFAGNEDGVVAVIFALMAIPFIALGGWAVDYIRLQHVHDYLQAQADTAALSYWIENELDDETEGETWRSVLMAELAREYQGDWARNVDASSEILGTGRVRITVGADVPMSFMPIVPGIPDTQLVTASAIALLTEPTEVREPPINTTLDPEAGDYNRIWMYCYWPDRPDDDPDRPKRTQMVPIADNGGSTFNPDLNIPPIDNELRWMYQDVVEEYEYGLDGRVEGIWRRSDNNGSHSNNRTYEYMMPLCQAGSHMSFRLENVRFSRTQPRFWDLDEFSEEGFLSGPAAANNGGDNHTGRYNYFTDTYFAPDSPTEQYGNLRHPKTGETVDILETVVCETVEECVPQDQGGIIPEGENRAPERADQACTEDRYMYYGWEDRPPGPGPSHGWQYEGWSDRDFDDIRIVVKCPVFTTEGERNARLVG